MTPTHGASGGGSTSRCGDVVRYVLSSVSPGSACASDRFYESYNELDVFLDFENCLPSDAERKLYEALEQLLQHAELLLEDLRQYGDGASALIREAIRRPDEKDLQRETFAAVSDHVRRTKAYHALALRIEGSLPPLLLALCSGPLSPAEQLDGQQALAKQMARLIDFVFRFDCHKMGTPALPNDFSFYRRVLSRSFTLRDGAQLGSAESAHAELELADTVSFFLANPTPMLHALSGATVHFVRAQPALPLSNTTDTLTAIVYMCRHMLERKDFSERISAATRAFFLRVMVGSLILFDHIDPAGGAFRRQSPIDVRAVCAVIKHNAAPQEAEQLMNALRYTAKHFSDAETPKSIRALFQ